MKTTLLNRVCLCAVVLILFSVSSLVAQDMFDTRIDYPAGGDPISVFSIDFNGAGSNDLVIANEYSKDVSMLLNTGPYECCMIRGDINHDGGRLGHF